MKYVCEKCKKEFPTPSKLKVHINRKISCDIPKINLKCEYCEVNFSRPAEKIRHDKTPKHQKNVTIHGDNNTVAIDSYNHIVNLTLQTNMFKDTNLNCIDFYLLENMYDTYIKNINRCDNDQFIINFRGLVEILKRVHFDLRNEKNQNLKILLMFPNLEKKIIEYMLLDINTETKQVHWERIEYEQLLNKLIILLEKLNEINDVKQFIKYIDYMKIALYKKENKANAEVLLTELYKKFNIEQGKDPRENGIDLSHNINIYKEYRDKELMLPNGHLPPVTNPLV